MKSNLFLSCLSLSLWLSALMLSDTGSRMWKVGRILNAVNIAVNPECISIDPAEVRCT